MNWLCEFRHPFGARAGSIEAGNSPQEAANRALTRFLRLYAFEPGFIPENSHPHLGGGRPFSLRGCYALQADPLPTPNPDRAIRIEAATTGLCSVPIVLLGWWVSNHPTVAMKVLDLDAEHAVVLGRMVSAFGGLCLLYGLGFLLLLAVSGPAKEL